MEKIYDVCILGTGVVGCAIARELSRYALSAAVLEKEFDVAAGASSRNSGVIHSGIHYAPGSLRAKLDVRGNALMGPLCTELNVRHSYIGKITVAQHDDELPALEKLKAQGEANGVPGLELIGPEKMNALQPGVKGIRALHSPSTGIVSPYNLTIALAENAHANGVDFYFGHAVTGAEKSGDVFSIATAAGKNISARIVINCTGVASAKTAELFGVTGYRIYPCRGEYYILDKKRGDALPILVYPVPHAHGSGLGVHLTKTVDGNILIGPSNEYLDDGGDYAATGDIMRKLREEAAELMPGLTMSDFIRNFSGVRAKQTPPEKGGFADYVIESRSDVKGFINLIGIESPGLTSSPAIAEMVRDMVNGIMPLAARKDFTAQRPGSARFINELSAEERKDRVASDPLCGEIICRCEQITKREIVDAVNNPLGIRTIAGLKYRSRAMMGRCQGGFCLPRIMRLLEEDFGFAPEDYMYKGPSSRMIAGAVRSQEGR